MTVEDSNSKSKSNTANTLEVEDQIDCLNRSIADLKKEEIKPSDSDTDKSNPKYKAEIIQMVDALQASVARLRVDFRIIIREELQRIQDETIKQIRKPRPYIESGYRG